MQFSIAFYGSGEVPSPSVSDLREMREELAEGRDWGPATAESDWEGDGLRVSAASHQWGDDMVRVWYVSNGKGFAKVTYTTFWPGDPVELAECERIVRSIRFHGEGDAMQ